MICEQIREMIEAYALGALDAPDQAMVETHLAECPACRQLLHEYAELINALAQAVALASPPQPPDSLKARLLQSLEATPPLTAAAAHRCLRNPGARLIQGEGAFHSRGGLFYHKDHKWPQRKPNVLFEKKFAAGLFQHRQN